MRVNERTLEHTPREYGLVDAKVRPGQEFLGQAIDINGAKIHVCWIKTSAPATVVFQYLTKNRDVVLEETKALELVPGDSHQRFQFGTYKVELPLPAMNLRMKFMNTGDQEAIITASGMSQLQ